MNLAVPIIIGILALAGLADSAYLSAIHFGFLHTEASFVSGMCGIHTGACGIVLQAKQSSIMGIPASVLGLLYFGMMAGIVAVRLTTGRWIVPWLTLALVGAGLAFSGYLVYTMLFELRKICPYCMTAHGINAALAALYAVSFRS